MASDSELPTTPDLNGYGERPHQEVSGDDVLAKAQGRYTFRVVLAFHVAFAAVIFLIGIVICVRMFNSPSRGIFTEQGARVITTLVALPVLAVTGYPLFAGVTFALALYFTGFRQHRRLCKLLVLPMGLVVPHGLFMTIPLFTALGHPVLKREFDEMLRSEYNPTLGLHFERYKQ